MQRLLVILVLGLTVAVFGLGYALSSLSTEVREDRLARERAAQAAERGGATREDDPERLKYLETKLRLTREAIDALREDDRKMRRQIDELVRAMARRSANPGPTPPPSTGPGTDATGDATQPARTRDADGNFVVTDEEMEYFKAVQAQLDRGRRIKGQTRNYMRRINSLVRRNEIAALGEAELQSVEKIVRAFVTQNDDLVSDYVRDPTPAAKMLDDDTRADQLRRARADYTRDAQKQLAKVLDAAVAEKIAESVFTNPWGIRRNR